MVTISRWLALALAVALTASGCGGSDDATKVGCSWFAGNNCWKDSAAAATACTDGLATGTFNAATTLCTYPDSTRVDFDPSASASASYANGTFDGPPWDFAVVSSTATTCARFKETDTSLTLTTNLGTFTESFAGSTLVLTCPDGSRVSIGQMDALSCDLADLPGFATSSGGGPIQFALLGAPVTDRTLWRCGP